MLAPSAAARLLAAAESSHDLLEVVRAAGCTGEAIALDADAMRRLGLETLAWQRAHLITGEGWLRALLLDVRHDANSRPLLREVVHRLDRHAPAALWLVVLRGSDLTIASWTVSPRRRIAALRFAPGHARPADAETVASLAATGGGPDAIVHARWIETLGRDSVGGRFYRTLDEIVRRMADEPPARIPPDDRRTLALIHVTRLLFLSYLEARGWLDGDARFLARAFDACAGGRGFQRRVLHPLFFGTLNTPVRRRAPAARAFGRIPFLNGGLFARTALERRHRVMFSDEAFGALFDTLLLRYRFTPREAQTELEESAVDPEMLGRAFESLMAAERRRDVGAFYTPLALVSGLVDRGLATTLGRGGHADQLIECALAGQSVAGAGAASLRRDLTSLTVLDPACGSGAFLVHALERIAGLLRQLGDPRTAGAIRRAVLARSIFGVDIDPTAVWLCELRLWLAVVVEHEDADPMAAPPLPNLDRQIRVGDALAGELPDAEWRQPGGRSVARLRERYARASGARKRSIAAELERVERRRALERLERECEAASAERRALIGALRGRDLFGARASCQPDDARRLAWLRERLRALRAHHRRLRDGGALPFAWSVHAADVLDRGGFDLVLGNPPWVRPHRIPRQQRAALRARYEAFAGGWSHGGSLARAGHGFAAQVDLAALFVERGLALCRPGGALAVLVPAKLWRSLAGGGVRRLLARRASVDLLEDWSAAGRVFDAAVYPAGLVARAGPPQEAPRQADGCTEVAVHAGGERRVWRTPRESLSLVAGDAAAPWVLLPPSARAAFDLLQRAGQPLAESRFGPPMLGVKTGCNEAFIVRLADIRGESADIVAGGRRGRIEAHLLRPVLRGESLGAGRTPDDEARIIWTHGPTGAPLQRLPRDAARWLAPFERRLRARTDLRGAARWWSLFRTASAMRERARVAWADVARTPRVRVLAPGNPTVALNSCYVLPCTDPLDAEALALLLGTETAAGWLAAIAEPARGGYHRHLAWTLAVLPIPRNWAQARDVILALAGEDDPEKRAALVAHAYRIEPSALAPLVEWNRG